MKKTWIAIAAFTLLSVSVIAFEMTNNEPNSQNKVTETVDFTVYRSATCGCCGKWIDHIEENNFSVGVRYTENMSAIKSEFGVAPKHQSCHTAVHDSGYVFEGHIPAEIMARFIDKPIKESIGLAVPGMPTGSPGMEYGNRVDAYTVRLLMKDGRVVDYASVSAEGIEYHI